MSDWTQPAFTPGYGIYAGHLVEFVDQHTCGAGGAMGHEPICGMEPIIPLVGWDHVEVWDLERYAAKVDVPVVSDDARDDDQPHYDDCLIWALPLPGPDACDCRRDEDGHARRETEPPRRAWTPTSVAGSPSVDLDHLPPCAQDAS